jgi:hypothetical protein
MKTPTHDEISRQARTIWQDRGCPEGIDTEIWLEAERQLAWDSAIATRGQSSSVAERAKAETAAESMVEYHISPALPEQEAIKAAQVKEARAPKSPKAVAPKAKPAETGKPLWDRPHSR